MGRKSDMIPVWFLLSCIGPTLLILVAIQGCANRTIAIVPERNVTGESITRAEIRREHAVEQIGQVKPHVDKAGKPHLTSAERALAKQRDDLASAATALQDERHQRAAEASALNEQLDALNRERATVDGRWWAVTGRWMDDLVGGVAGILTWIKNHWWWVVGGIALLRSLGLVIPGLPGAVLSAIANVLAGVITDGVSLIITVGESIWHRIKPSSRGADGQSPTP